MKEPNNYVKVRSYTTAFEELENISHAGFNYVVCHVHTCWEYPVIYLNAFYYFHDADAFCTLLNRNTDEEYEVFSIDELAYHLDCKTCEIIEGESID